MNTKNPAPAKNQAQAASLYPNKPGFKPAKPVVVGGEILMNAPIEYNTGRKTVKLVVRNTGDRPIQVGSHFHFFEVNRYLEFDRDAAFGCHLNIHATTAIRFEPGDQKEVEVGQTPRDRRQRSGDGIYGRRGCAHLFPGTYACRAQSPACRVQEHFGKRCRGRYEKKQQH